MLRIAAIRSVRATGATLRSLLAAGLGLAGSVEGQEPSWVSFAPSALPVGIEALGRELGVVLPHYYEQAWFRGLCVTGLLLLAFGGHRWRLARRRLRTEIAERNRAERALRATEDSLRVVAETATDVIITIDTRSRVLYANPAANRLFGIVPGELVGKSITLLMPERDRIRHLKAMRDFAATGARSRPWEGLQLTARRMNGTEFPIEISLGDHLSPDGRRVVTAIVRDVTERHRLQQRLADSQKMEALGRTAGGIAHDFNNILTALLGNAELASRSNGNHRRVESCLSQIRECGDRAASLTKQLLAFSRRQLVHPTVIEPDVVVAGLEPLLARLIPESVQTVFDFRADGARIVADPSQIEQLVINLALNARDAMPTGGRLEISSTVVEVNAGAPAEVDGPGQGMHLRLSVSDTGTGIPAESLPHLFEPFFTTKPVGEGTGLGLASVHGIVQQAGGHIRVDTSTAKGTTFVVHLPCVEAAPLPAARDVGGGEELASTGTVLVCDDYEPVLSIAEFALQVDGHAVLVANHPATALDLAASNPGSIDVLVTDVVMPGMNGRQLAERIRVLHPSIHVLYVTGYATEEFTESDSEEHLEVLTKPFTPGQLRARVRALLTSRVESGAVG